MKPQVVIRVKRQKQTATHATIVAITVALSSVRFRFGDSSNALVLLENAVTVALTHAVKQVIATPVVIAVLPKIARRAKALAMDNLANSVGLLIFRAVA
jgi:hypothetical protein